MATSQASLMACIRLGLFPWAMIAGALRQYDITRPLASPYSLHTLLLKVKYYNDSIMTTGVVVFLPAWFWDVMLPALCPPALNRLQASHGQSGRFHPPPPCVVCMENHE